MDSKDQLTLLCNQSLEKLGLSNDKRYVDRLKWELIETDVQDCYSYFLDLKQKGLKLPNENNCLIPFLLGICSEVNVDKEPECTIGEFPDIDTDLIEPVRNWLRDEWAPKTFGKNRVANIGTYQTYHANAALIDMARIFGKDRQEVLNITTKFEAKDDDGDPLTWDSALELYPQFKEYCERYPDVADAAKRLCGRNRTIGQHAAGVIIAGCDLDEIVPLMGKDYKLTTAWTEGQANADLSSVGLVKFDWLGVDSLQHIAECLVLIKERHGIESISALPGQPSWSDTSYLEDNLSLKMANEGDTKMVFQFGSDGIRKLLRQGGVTRFEDLVAYNAIFRPGPLAGGVGDMYARRKRGEEEYEIHPVIKPILSKSYGLMVFQEDVMRILNTVGKIPLRDCVAVIKAISKKKIEKFAKYKDMFVDNGQKVLNEDKTYVEDLWKKIEFFAGYGFNRAHSVSYGYVAARQLYLKSHFAIEYYATGLNHVNGADRDAKLREFKREVENHGIRVRRPNLNKSKVGFSIVDDQIYFGFAEIKGIGPEVAKRIVDGQPYAGFEDFLTRFGTDAKVVQALVALRVFDDADPVILYKFYECWKKHHKKKDEQDSRYEKSITKYKAQLKELIGDLEVDLTDDLSMAALSERIQSDTYKAVKKIAVLYRKSISRYHDNKENFAKYPLHFETFDHAFHMLDEEDEIVSYLNDIQKAEQKYLGFVWTHPLESCPDAKDYTFEQYKIRGVSPAPVEVLITKIMEKVGKVRYYLMFVEDLNWESGIVTVWEDDYKRFKEDLKEGNLVRLKLKPPDPGFNRYTLDGYPKWKKHLLPPKEQDYRVVVLNAK